MQLMAHHEVRENAVVVRFDGEIDLAVADEFRSHLKEGLKAASTHPGRSLIIDLHAVSFFASVNDVLQCHNEGTAHGIAVGLITTSYIVIRAIQATQLDEILTVYPTIDDALAVFWADKGGGLIASG